MKRIMFLCLPLLALMAREAMSAAATPCESLGNRLSASEITNRFGEKLICAEKMGAISGNDRWAEVHRADGQLWEQGKGTTSKIHPPTKVGTWKAVEANKGKSTKSATEDLVQYDYIGGSSYSWSVFEKDVAGTKTYTFCGSNATKVIATAKVIAPNPSSTNACGF